MKNIKVLIVVLLAAVSLTGCYWWREVQANEIGLELDDGVSISQIVPAGRYSNNGWFADLKVIDVAAKTSAWSDPDLVTKDKQPIGLDVTVTYARKRDDASIRQMWQLYRAEATSDDALSAQILSRIPAAAKSITTEYTLDDMLGVSDNENASRQIVTQKIFDLLKPEFDEVGVDLLDVRITNIAVDPVYLALLSEKAQIQLKADIAKQQTAQLIEQEKQEKQKTLVEMEIARRQNLVNEEMSKAYSSSPELFRIKMLELLKDMFRDTDKVLFIPPDSDLSIILGTQGVIPTDNNGDIP